MRNIVILNSLHFSYPLPILMRVSYNTLIVKQNTSDYYKYTNLLSKATSLKTFFTQMLAYYKILRTFASLLKGSTLTKEFWRGGRVVDCGGLENRCTARYPGFESLSLRNKR